MKIFHSCTPFLGNTCGKSTMWKVIPCTLVELNLPIVLAGGQSFRWHETEEGLWTSVLHNRIWSLKQDPQTGNLSYFLHSGELKKEKKNKRVKVSHNGTNKSCTTDLTDNDCQRILTDYFQLSIKVQDLYAKWAQADEHFQKISVRYPGIRILRQDPTENLFSFICSSNNNISRISSMVQKLCENWGQYIGEVNGRTYHSFPTVDALCGSEVETRLRELGFGYRAKYISETAKVLHNEQHSDWLLSLRDMSYEDVHKELVKLPGVGAKVADCVCLMSLDKQGAIPVDTHVWQIATRDYLPDLKKNKSITPKAYKEIGDFFRERFGEYAGWAHSVLFCADLKKFVIKGS